MYKFEDGPFNSSNEEFSSSFYKELMDKEENRSQEYLDSTINAEEVEYVEVQDSEPVPSKQDDPFRDEEYDASKMLSSSTKKGFSSQVTQIMNASQNLLSQNNITSTEVVATFKQLFQDLNDTYGLEVQFDFNSFSRTLGYMIKPKNKQAIEIYISEAYSRVRATLYFMYLNAISQLSQQILDPKFITSNSMTYSEKLILMRELFQYINSLNEIYKEVNIEDSDIKLKKLSEDSHEDSDLNDPSVQEFLQSLSNSVKSKNK